MVIGSGFVCNVVPVLLAAKPGAVEPTADPDPIAFTRKFD